MRELRDDMDKRFEQVNQRFEQVNQRFEQVNQRFEETNRRFETVFNLLYIIMGIVFASPFIAIYLRDKKEAEERKLFDNIKGMLFVFREQALDDEKLSRSLI